MRECQPLGTVIVKMGPPKQVDRLGGGGLHESGTVEHTQYTYDTVHIIIKRPTCWYTRMAHHRCLSVGRNFNNSTYRQFGPLQMSAVRETHSRVDRCVVRRSISLFALIERCVAACFRDHRVHPGMA